VKVALIAATVVILAATATVGYLLTGRNSQPSTTSHPSTATQPPTTTPPVPPVAEAALQGLLLSADQINAAMGATGMTVTQTWNTLLDVGENPAVPPECLPEDGALEAGVYAGSGWTAMRGQKLKQPRPSDYTVDQGVVLFPSAQAAVAFAGASQQSWSACVNRSYTSGGNQWSAGPMSTTNGTLTSTITQQGTNWACQRALTASNNVVIDVSACTHGKTTDQGASIAGQIAAKVPT
jgi:hypothetical protein